MKVMQVTDNMRVLPNHVYIIPPNKEMVILNGTLQLLELRKPRSANLPIDIFLRSLAQDRGSQAIGIILSGTGTDGTLGVRAIKGETGLIMVQDLESAKHDGMPRSAIATDLVDYILPPEKMPTQLCRYVRHQGKKTADWIDPANQKLESALNKIFILLRTATNHDFSSYKRNTICRRIERRMHIHQIGSLNDYVRYLQESDRETKILFKELLIGVTSFFRDPEAWELLKENYLPQLLQQKPDNYQIRVWVPGCSSGEEAYGTAIVLQECMETMGRHFVVQVFGTDLDEEAIQVARNGLFPESIAADLSAERLRRFFTKCGNQYQAKKSIRDMIVFAPQNIIKDPPFTKLDLLCCRNLLIYFGTELQKKLLPVFRYSLKADGILFLGSSESIGQTMDSFIPLDKKWKIFKRHPAVDKSPLHFPVDESLVGLPEKETTPAPFKPSKDINISKLLQAVLSQSSLPACVVIDDAANIIYIHGRTGHFLEPAEGKTSVNIIAMARPGLKAGLTSAIRKMGSERQEITVKGLPIENNGSTNFTNLTLRPLPNFQTGHQGLMMVIFDEVKTPSPDSGKNINVLRSAKGDDLRRLEDELQYTKENLQTTIEELETSNEELKSTNEELQSTNEELQSTNEELETSKEELQSLNEESATVNSELQSRIDELVAANDDIKNLLDATEIATLFLDSNLNIRRFTNKTLQIFPLKESDQGRPISHFSSSLKDINLLFYAEKVLADLERQELEARDNGGHSYHVRLRPYRTTNNVIDGVVITFEDISKLKQLSSEARLAAVIKDSNDAIILHDFKGEIVAWNRGAEKLFGYTETEAKEINIMTITAPQYKSEIKSLMKKLDKTEIPSLVIERLHKNGQSIPVWLTMSRVQSDSESGEPLVATTERGLGQLNPEALKQQFTGGSNGKR